MRIPLFAFLLCSCFFTVHAQTYFSKVVSGPELDLLGQTTLTSQGELVTVGSYKDSLNIYETNIFVQKMDTTGNMIWTYQYDAGEHDRVYNVIESLDGNLLIVGYSDSLSGPDKGLLMKVDMNGNLLWNKTYLPALSGINSSRFTHVITTSDSALLLSGILNSGSTSSLFFVKTDLNGDVLWSNSTSLSSSAWPVGLVESRPGEYTVAAQLSASIARSAVVTFDDMGNVLSSLKLEDFWLNLDVRAMVDAGNGEKILCGEFGISPFLARVDANDSLLWLYDYSSSGDGFRAIKPLSNGNFVTYSEYSSLGNKGHSIMEFDGSGNPISYYWVDSDNRFVDRSLFVGPDGSLFLWAEISYHDGTGQREAVIIRSSVTGQGTCPAQQGNISPTPFGVSQSFNHFTIYLPPEVNSLTINRTAPQTPTFDLCPPVGIDETDWSGLALHAFPNPTRGRIGISINEPIIGENLEVSLYDFQGRRLMRMPIEPGVDDLQMDLSGYASGVYWIRFTQNGELRAVRKVVREY